MIIKKILSREMYVLLVHNTEPASPSNPSLLCTTLPTGTSTWTSSLDGSGGTSTSTPRPGSSLRNLLMVPRREVLLSLSLNLSTSCLLMLLEMLIPVCQDSVRSVYKLKKKKEWHVWFTTVPWKALYDQSKWNFNNWLFPIACGF